MNKTILIVAAAVVSAASLYAQDSESLPIDLGFKVGIPITNMFSASNTSEFGETIPGSPFSSAVPRYEFGVSGEFHLYKRFRFELDGLYKRGGFDSVFASGGGFAYSPTAFNWWEIPGLIKTDVSLGHVRPFVDFGAALRHISTIDQTTYSAGLFDGVAMTDNSIALHNRNSYGGVAGIGITFKKGALRISPEVRYTRWANEAFEYTGFRTNLNQGDFLLGINF